MRLYTPSTTVACLERLLAEEDVSAAVAAHRVLPARPPQLMPLPEWLDDRLVGALHGRGIDALYRHQADALAALRAGQDIVVVTPTASGKSLCYDLPVLQALAEDRQTRALYLFPTKALSQDQLAGFRRLAADAGLQLAAAIYDGDTPGPVRSSIRAAGQVVLSNPDMLHAAILPHHTRWFQLFEQLRFIVVDEAHTYRGVFGSHVANVLHRLLRLCAHYGSRPQVICCSATIGNAQALAETLTGRSMTVIERNGAPSGEKHIVVLNPPVVDPRAGMRASGLGLARRAALAFLRAGRQTIVFGRSRVGVELLLTGLREALREGRGPLQRVRGYRGGYLPSERRQIEAGLRSGEILGVVSTNALELGIDIGRLDVAVLAGYPGTIAGTWQQMGRAGRRAEASVAILVAGPGPVDQFVAGHPDYLFAASPEEARLDPTNLHVLLAHTRAAIFELPFGDGDQFCGVAVDELLEFLAEEGHVRHADDGRWYWASENFPASAISLRVAAPENVVIVDTAGPRPRVIGEVDLFSAPTLVHENAIYLHESRQYHVDRLEWDERRAYVRPVDVDHYTQAELAVTLKPLETFAAAAVPAGERAHGEVMVSSLATIYKKLRLETHENLGWGRIHLPEIELHTTSYWLALDPTALAGWRRDELDSALAGMGRAMQTLGSILLMADPRDLGMVAQVRSPHAERPLVYLYDAVPGGVG
ncbi:MAG: DEAD/DEAH box helicase, partial [Chloroflexota bacterium]|nr:DEAD/DEAH box helicase [Chloroflexota bacterium]